MAKTNREIADMLGQLGHHEREVAEWVIAGLCEGRHVYGELDLSRDPRNWRVEMLQEIRDALVYAACKALCVPDGAIGTPDQEKLGTGQEDEPGEAWTGGGCKHVPPEAGWPCPDCCEPAEEFALAKGTSNGTPAVGP